MKLRMFLHDELVATLDTGGPVQLATRDTVAWTPGIARVSAAWDETPELEMFVRSDRYLDPESGTARPRHQEEFCQACGWPSALKYDWGRKEEPRWEAAYAILRRCNPNPSSAQAMLTRTLAACWAIGHTDLHRRNLGFLHAPPDDPFGVDIAPMYDVSSGIGVEQIVQFRMAIGIARQAAFDGIGPVQWLEHARTAEQDPAAVLAIVSHTLQDLPDALADARRLARQEDENRNQGAVDSRAERLLAYIEKRRRTWNATLGRMKTSHYSPFVAHHRRYAALPPALDPEILTNEQDLALVAEATGPSATKPSRR